jgi:N-acetylglutamate synthase-like GNAT family acetyltransferase
MTSLPQIDDPSVDLQWHTGSRSELRRLFMLAEDSPEQLDSYLHLGRVLVAHELGSVVGYVQIVELDATDQVELKSMAVVEDRQRQGIGRVLVKRVIDECRSAGAGTVFVATATADIGNLRFYQRLHFRMLRIERDAFTPSAGYPSGLTIDGIPLRDRDWLSMSL